jgi:predicted nucleic acid-binding Zn ribbon protein
MSILCYTSINPIKGRSKMSSRYIEVNCAICGKKFKTSNRGRTCSYGCRTILKERDMIARARIDECPICGNTAPLYRECHGEMVCSKRCVIVLNNRSFQKSRGYDVDLHQRIRVPPKVVVCEVCGKSVEGRRYDQKYCSPECKIIAQHRRKSEQRKERRAREKKCSLCGVHFDEIPSPHEIGYKGTGFGDYKMHMDQSNLRPTCWFCNLVRGTMDADLDKAVAAASRAFWKKAMIYWQNATP